jgi:hypothetical protein
LVAQVARTVLNFNEIRKGILSISRIGLADSPVRKNTTNVRSRNFIGDANGDFTGDTIAGTLFRDWKYSIGNQSVISAIANKKVGRVAAQVAISIGE